MSLVQQIFRTSDWIDDGRDELEVLAHVVEEVGELAQEITIHRGLSYKQPGADGVVGEALDAIVCLFDLIRIHNPGISEQQLCDMVERKLAKWANTKLGSKTNDVDG